MHSQLHCIVRVIKLLNKFYLSLLLSLWSTEQRSAQMKICSDANGTKNKDECKNVLLSFDKFYFSFERVFTLNRSENTNCGALDSCLAVTRKVLYAWKLSQFINRQHSHPLAAIQQQLTFQKAFDELIVICSRSKRQTYIIQLKVHKRRNEQDVKGEESVKNI